MKKHLLLALGIACLTLLPIGLLFGQSKTITIGQTQHLKGLITDLNGAQQVLKANLPAPALVSDLRIEYAYAETLYYLSGRVSNVNVNAIFISLHENGGQLFAMAGPGKMIKCVGSDCMDCRNMHDGRPCCHCSSGSGHCDMTSEIDISL